MKLLRLGFLAGAILLTASLYAKDKPNIVFILADDVGYGDLGCYGGKHAKTPNLDRLAAQGRRFLDAHSHAATCTPSRRALLTGVYSWRQEPGSRIAPGDTAITIPPGTTTIATLMKAAGYRTGIVGKWHLGLGPDGDPDWNGEIKPGPLDLGFDEAFIMAATGDQVPTVYIENRRVVGLDSTDPIKVNYKEKIGDDPTGSENPELLKLKHTHGHNMTIVNGIGRIGWMSGGNAARWVDEDMSDTFAGKAVAFIEKHQQQPFFLCFTPHNIHVPRVPHTRFKGSNTAGTRGDHLQELDDAVGQVMAALDKHGLSDNTLIIFTSDNGGVMDDGYEDVGSFDYHPNAPLTGYKGGLYEGGHRVPFIARWPKGIPAGTESQDLITLIDMAATFASLSGAAVPTSECRDSLNVWPAFSDEYIKRPLRETFIAHVGGTKGSFAVRLNHWKFIERGGHTKYGRTPETKDVGERLYDLSKDLAETTNVIAQHPEIAAQMRRILVTEGARQQP